MPARQYILAPVAPRTPQPQADLNREYVAGGGYLWYRDAVRALPHAIDDVTRQFGDDLYERMSHDPQVDASLTVLKAGVLGAGMGLKAAETDVERPEHARAAALLQWCEAVLNRLDTPLIDVLRMMLDALAYGHKIAEVVYELVPTAQITPVPIPDLPLLDRVLRVQAIKPKPRGVIAFVVDPFLNVSGLLARRPGEQHASFTVIGDPANLPDLLPRTKFAVLSYEPKDGDPRGTSILRPAYNGWWCKLQTWPEYLKYLAQFASASVVATTAEGAQPARLTNPTLTEQAAGVVPIIQTPEEALVLAVQDYQNGSALVVPFGTEVDVVPPAGNGEAFLAAFDLFGREIVQAILAQTRATMEAENGSKADSETGQDVLGTIMHWIKGSVERMVYLDILVPLVRWNFGDDWLALTPHVSLGDVEQQDWAAIATAIAGLHKSNFFAPEQLSHVDGMLGLPPRTSTQGTTQGSGDRGQGTEEQDA